MKSASKRLKHVGAITVATAMIFAGVFALGPLFVKAPPLQQLDVVFTDKAPNTGTFPGDVNVTMLSLDFTATGGDVQVTSIDFTLTGSTGDIASVALWDDATDDGQPQWYECQLGMSTVMTSSFTIPGAGTLKECSGPGDYFVSQFSPRSILVFLTVDVGATEFNTISLEVTAINSPEPVTGGTGTTKTIEILHKFFEDDMESGPGSWKTEGWDKGHMHEPDGLWHLSSGEEDCINNNNDQAFFHSYNTGWWYGHRYPDPFGGPTDYVCIYYTWMPGQYLTSTRNMGNLTTPQIDATTGSSLSVSFWHLLIGESDTPLYKIDNGDLWLHDIDLDMWHKINPLPWDSTTGSWWKVTLNLSAYAGKHVELELRFDTVDTMNNVFLGWFVDDLTVYGKTEAHDIAVPTHDAPPADSPSGSTLFVNGTFSNIGTSDETGIGTRLTVDNATVDTDTIASLLSGTSQVVLHT
ncbi:MAG: hypothetical protein JSV43_08930, partial [Methanobacteriota archaeon]